MMGRHATVQEQHQMGRQMMDVGQHMENMGHQMEGEHGSMQTSMQTPPQGAAPATPR
jgi:hypothetical protein